MSPRNTTTNRFCAAGLAAAVGAAAWLPATAQESQELSVEVGECVELTSPAERLACFEAQVEAAQQDRSSVPDRPAGADPSERRAPAAEIREAPASERAPAAEVRREPARVADPPRESSRRRDSAPETAVPVEFVAKVTELRPTVPNSYVITLDNGQVWRQNRPEAYPLQIGTEVRIYSTRWGYRLANARLRGFIQVERVR